MATAVYKRVKPELDKLADRTKAFYGPDLLALVLFGSGARGDLTVSSDVDLFIILKTTEKSFRERIKDFYRGVGDTLEDEFGLFLSPVIFTEEEVRQFRPFFLGVFDEFKVLYDEKGIVQEILGAIKELKDRGSIEELYFNGIKYWKIHHEKETYRGLP